MTNQPTREMFQQILDRAPGAPSASRTDPTTGVMEWLYVSPRLGSLFGVSDEELRSSPANLIQRIHPDDLPLLESELGRATTTMQPVEYAARIVRADGEVRWIESQLVPELAPDGAVIIYSQTTDVTARKALEQSLHESELARRRAETLNRQVIDGLPVGVIVGTPDLEFPVWNPEHERMVGPRRDHGGDVGATYGIFLADGVTPLRQETSGLVRALRGEDVDEEVVFRRAGFDDVRARVVWRPLRDDDGHIFAAQGTSQDITTQRRLEADLRARNEQLGASEAAKAELIERLRYSIDELSNPIIEVWDDVLAMPIIGIIDSRRTADMVHRLLGEVARTQASFVIVDLTGVEIVDTKTADHLMKLMRKVEIVGARCVLTGIRPAVAETLVDIGVDFGRVGTLRNLKHGLREALRLARREREGREANLDDDQPDEAPGRRRGR